jgi:hypothetical protein
MMDTNYEAHHYAVFFSIPHLLPPSCVQIFAMIFVLRHPESMSTAVFLALAPSGVVGGYTVSEGRTIFI